MEITNINHKEEFNPSDLTTVAKLSVEWGVTRTTIYNWVKDGKIKQVEFLGKKFLDKSTFNPQISTAMLEVIIANHSKKTA